MNEINHSVEALTNPILKILLFALFGAVLAMGTAIVYLFRMNTVRYIDMTRDNISALANVTAALDSIEQSQTDNVAEIKAAIQKLREQIEESMETKQ